MSKTAILIVEDEGIVAADLARKLEQLGYEIAGTAERGEEAVTLTLQLHPDLVLMDIWLKGSMDGIEAAEAIRRDYDVPVVYLTAHSDPATLARAKLTGPFGYILKPFEPRELATQIEMALYRHQADRQLRQQREWLQITLASIGDAVIATNAEGRISILNPVAESLTGWKAEEVLGQPLQSAFRIVNEQTGQTLEDPVARVLCTRRVVALANHAALISRDGHTVPIEDTAAPILDAAGQILGVVLVFHDVTQKRRSEEALYESETRAKTRADELAALMDSMPAITFIAHDPQCREMTHSRAARELLQLPANSSLSAPEGQRPTGYRAFKNGSELKPDELPVQIAAATGSEVRDFELTLVFSDEKRRDIIGNAVPLFGGDGKVSGAVGAFIDITERKQAEKALRDANTRLSDADKRKDEFLAMLAHELRNPLAAISSAIELLKLRGHDDPTLVRARNSASRQAAHMARLLDDLLDVARVTQGKVTLNKEDVSLHSILESAVEASNPLMNAHNHRLYVSHPRQPMHVHGDQVRLSQAVTNLLHNSAKYTAPGGEIYLAVEREGDQAAIVVRDNGKGIETELLPHVFELFVQGSRGADRADGGLGIGLTLVRSLVELHGGRVEARSDGRGRGSEFRIYLPLLHADEERFTKTGIGKAEQTKPLRILVVDDNQDSAELLSVLLELKGHKTVVANSGPAAIDLAFQHVPEVALIDIGMPGMNGYEVARRMHASPELKHMSLVAITGYGQQEDIQKSREAGFDDHLVKPVDMEVLGRVLQRIGEH